MSRFRRAFTCLAVSLGAGGAALVTPSCGGGTVGSGATGDAGAPDVDAGWTQCSTPAGLMVCGGPAGCNPPNCTCLHICDDAGDLSVCLSPALPTPPCGLCEDGNVCVMQQSCSAGLDCVPYDYGVLFANNGGSGRVRYADFSDWTGATLPTPDTCPTLTGATVCGGHCGGCAATEVCTGRSPLHPYGICVASMTHGCRIDQVGPGGYCGSTSLGCYTFKVQPDTKVIADTHGLCLPVAQCQALAAQLPGGGTCTQ